MSSDASAAAASPMTNGTSCSEGHREADASTTSAATRSLAEVCADLNQRVANFLNAAPENEVTRRTQEQARISIGVIEKALRDYSFDALSLSYNGGKDCLVLLILYLSTLHAHYTHKSRSHDFPTSIPSIYAKPPDPFPSVTSFVDSSSAQYHLDLTHVSTNPGTRPNPSKAKSHSSPPITKSSNPLSPTTGSPDSGKIVTFRDAFALYLSARPQVKAIFVGTRRTDPHGAQLTHFDHTDGNWPPFMRIHPVVDWHLSEIWTFLRSPHLADPKGPNKTLDYCAMYDEGYTSLGGVGDTLRNPKLRYVDSESGEEKYKPAYALTEDGEERLGRE